MPSSWKLELLYPGFNTTAENLTPIFTAGQTSYHQNEPTPTEFHSRSNAAELKLN
jgi:hypothetical protein